MDELIKLNYVEGREKFPVSARHLHAFLGSKRQYIDWITDRIEQYEFTEDEDYIFIHEKVKKSDGTKGRGRPKMEYYLTMDMAKELSMIESTERGKQARKYFIEMEKIAVEEFHEAGYKLQYDKDFLPFQYYFEFGI
jgi:phage anti-repressor protein